VSPVYSADHAISRATSRAVHYADSGVVGLTISLTISCALYSGGTSIAI
jgi:hypothetical protein